MSYNFVKLPIHSGRRVSIKWITIDFYARGCYISKHRVFPLTQCVLATSADIKIVESISRRGKDTNIITPNNSKNNIKARTTQTEENRLCRKHFSWWLLHAEIFHMQPRKLLS